MNRESLITRGNNSGYWISTNGLKKRLPVKSFRKLEPRLIRIDDLQSQVGAIWKLK